MTAAGITAGPCFNLLAAFPALAGAPLTPLPIDGHGILPLLLGKPGARSPWDDQGFCYYRMERLDAVRAGPWMLYLKANTLYDVRHDVGETREVFAEHSQEVARLLALAEATRAEIGDTGHPGPARRPAGHIDNPQPLLPIKP